VKTTCESIKTETSTNVQESYFFGNPEWMKTMPSFSKTLGFGFNAAFRAQLMDNFVDVLSHLHAAFDAVFVSLRKWLQYWDVSSQNKALRLKMSYWKIPCFECIYQLCHTAYTKYMTESNSISWLIIIKSILPLKRDKNCIWNAQFELCPTFKAKLFVNSEDACMIWIKMIYYLFESQRLAYVVRCQWKYLMDWWQFSDVIRSFIKFLQSRCGGVSQSNTNDNTNSQLTTFTTTNNNKNLMFE
jgi:hypothetical protein